VSSEKASVRWNGGSVSAVWHPPLQAPQPPRGDMYAVLGHGAGGNLYSPGLAQCAEALAARGVGAVRFNFPYAEARRKIPDRQATLEACYRAVAERVAARSSRLVLGGRSMGGRIASHVVAGGFPAAGLLFLGYPLHPPGQPDRLRDAHLGKIPVPMLFLQGSRDAFAGRDAARRGRRRPQPRRSRPEDRGRDGRDRRSGHPLDAAPAVNMSMRAYRAEVIGSLLRPDYLLQARAAHAAGAMSEAAFKRIEDRAVDEAIAIQEQAGVDVVTDGEQRRNLFASQLVQATDGFAAVPGNRVDWFTMDGRVIDDPVTVGLVGKIKRRRHLSAEEFTYLRAKTTRPTKVTIPSPTMFAYYWVPGVSSAAYPSTGAYLADVTDVLRDEVAELVRLGATYIQIDAPEFGMLIDPHQQQWFRRKGFDPDRLLDDGIEMINAVIAGHAGVTFGLHICRGNDKSRYMAKGSYARISGRVFERTRAQRLLLEYDDERSGDFSPLRDVPPDKVVVLGLITTKWPREETVTELGSRIEEASAHIPLERLALSPQCGFASVAQGNTISADVQARKLRLVAEAARAVWHD
jgi:5-methyltetrahydropteroyltriglutamate--homocysteine methyltransferase